MLNDFRLAFTAFREPIAIKVLGISLLLSFVLLFLLAVVVAWMVVATGLMPGADAGWVQFIGGGLGFIITFVIGWFLFPSMLSAVSGLFLEHVADAIERRSYPLLPPARPIGVREQMSVAFRAARRALGRNIAFIPFYFVPGVNFLVYVYVNGRAMGEEYFLTVALRRRSPAECETLFSQHKDSLYRTGYLISLISVLPGLNLVAPLLAVSLMTHRHARLI